LKRCIEALALSGDTPGEGPEREFWEHHWGLFDGDWTDRDRARARIICSMIPAGVTSVLEVGCGDGLIINSVTAPDTMGVDISRAGLSSVQGPSLLCSLEELPFEDGRYDLVIASEVLEHLPEEIYQRSLSEIARVARAHILLSVPHREYLKANITRCPSCGREYHRNLHERSYRPRDLVHLFGGFEMVSLNRIGPKEPRRTRLEVLVRRVLDRGVPHWNTVCPHCNAVHGEPGGGTPEASEGPYPAATRDRKASRLKQLFKRHKSPWMAALYSRKGVLDG
jgi:SAM-dependent methyltransferase